MVNYRPLYKGSLFLRFSGMVFLEMRRAEEHASEFLVEAHLMPVLFQPRVS